MSVTTTFCAVLVLVLGAGAGAANRGYVAEWQWERWPQQVMSDNKNATRSPGARMGSSLWFDSLASSWWLFGGRQLPSNSTKLKIYTDLWRYDTNTRRWSRVFPNDKLRSNVGGMILLRTNLFSDGHTRKSSGTVRSPGVVLCGRSEGKRLDERSLAVYGPRSSRSDTVWQLELKDKQWTAYVCCCDSTGPSPKDSSAMPTGTLRNESSVVRNYTVVHGSMRVADDSKTSSISDGIAEQSATKHDIGKPNNLLSDKDNNDHVDNIVNESNVTLSQPEQGRDNSTFHNISSTGVRNTDSSLDQGKQCLPNADGAVNDISNRSEASDSHSRRSVQERDFKQTATETNVPTNDSATQAFCPDFEAGGNGRAKGQPVAWCDTTKELLVALDLRALPLTLWQFDLRTSHWAQQKVEIEEGTLWPGCSPNVRYASTGSTVYILCPPYEVTNATSTRLVYRIDAGNATLQALGQLQLNVVFGYRDGDVKWADETRTVLQAVEADSNRTLLLVAYDKLLDLWVLDRTGDHACFLPVENIWRGSALKWFRGFDAPFYNLQMAGQSWLLPNPRQVTEYWPQERGRFIIRLTDHGESTSGSGLIKEELHTLDMKNHSEVTGPILQHHQPQDGIKALVFFAFSLSIFAIFGMAVFVRRCVTCPPQSWPLRGDDGSKTTPPVIRYSVIPDDLAYPVA
ncbi:uncharacterized protein [Periplaneta americana]|uniref:uncharacterized protein n=1 Tax=Periplaneta americana TaxID=6978 RepID=UPI0037E89F78